MNMQKDKDNGKEFAIKTFGDLCEQTETVAAFIAVTLDEEGFVSVGSSGLEQHNMVDVLENVVEFLKNQAKEKKNVH